MTNLQMLFVSNEEGADMLLTPFLFTRSRSCSSVIVTIQYQNMSFLDQQQHYDRRRSTIGNNTGDHQPICALPQKGPT
jgi:hypothetical protein